MILRKAFKDIFKFSASNLKNFRLKILPKPVYYSQMADQGKRTKETTGESIHDHSKKIGGDFKLTKSPVYINNRIQMYDALIQNQKQKLALVEKLPIKITLKDGKVLEGVSFQTTPHEIARKISKKLAENVIIAKVTYIKKLESPLDFGLSNTGPDQEETNEKVSFHLHDLDRPLEGDCTLELLDFEDPLGKMVFWHSSAHVLGEALEVDFGCHLCIGPPLASGFYYDAFMGAERITPGHFEEIEKTAKSIIDENQKFERIVLTKEEALEMFKENPFKVQLIQNKVPEGGKTTAYRCGKLIDLCTGPHIPATGIIKALKVTKSSSAYWLANSENDDLQRVYGISFPNKKQLEEYVRIQEELQKRDHRNIGTQFDLFRFSNLSPGSTFFFPHGALIYNKLIEFIRQEYRYRGYSEVISPNMYSSDLWKISGHWDMYQENMFLIDQKGEEVYGLKPMNCPGHCLMFDMSNRSYRDLPIRYADFGVLHRNEIRGALSGLTRVRRFQQDDSHIFCRIDQLMEEVFGVLDLLKYVYDTFGFEFKLELSTRPEKFLGKVELWDLAEKYLAEALTNFGKHWTINKGDGAFYGPKIDVKLFDSLKREHQCGTIQVDFVLPERFDLQFRSAEGEEELKKKKDEVQNQPHAHAANACGEEEHKCDKKGKKDKKEHKEKKEEKEEVAVEKKIQVGHGEIDHSHKKAQAAIDKPLKPGFERPVIIHRAILGSVERMMAILCEHYAGKFPFWLSPRQVIVLPLSEKIMDYAEKVQKRLILQGFASELDSSNVTLNKKIRNAQLAQFNYIVVVGEKEEKKGTVNLRDREKQEPLGEYTIAGLIDFFDSLSPAPSNAQLNLEKKSAQIKNFDLEVLDNELKEKVFLEGEGFQRGQKDDEVFEKLKEHGFEEKAYPNLARWKRFLSHQQKS